ncbi:hypothetical protein NLI96_g11666 [Meripilus lineatus]|uniref:NADH-ubiquinone oxidoreductase 21 kDa subunit n=1 Tax=Meripilus lineatus TaxID=2056292 RepID=A0AAD5URD4_9APHY|nr:hypothetical protein NLI96_g11666 [Physisporinus lineatus]
MPNKVVETPYPLIDADPHAGRVIRYMRPSDLGVWAAATGAFPAAIYFWDMADPSKFRLRTPLRLGGFLGFVGGFLFAYQRSSLRFWGWSENKREEELDRQELTQRVQQGLPAYGKSDQPEWVQGAAHRNSVFSQLKFNIFPMVNLVHHQHHGRNTEDFGEKRETPSS